ncbi:MAG: hypothetical protein C5B47_08000 [Verrucomicrobia bacterium]|nr:MAG: hypothetical protein C5B47_08000 [Verrucomicrobiota bacterium]
MQNERTLLAARTSPSFAELLDCACRENQIQTNLVHMPIRYKDLAEVNFDQNDYSKNRPLGIWRATVDQTVWSKGSKTSASQKGKRAGIHLYVQHENGRKIWLFLPLLPGLVPFAVAAELQAGDVIELELVPTSSGLSVVKRLQRIRPE